MRRILFFILVIIMMKSHAQWTDNGSSLTTSDNVGIGTTTPRSSLDINGTLTWGTGAELSNAQGASIELRGTGVPFIDFSNDALSDYDMRLILRGNDILEIQGGNVGIGTAAPLEKLHVSGNILAQKLMLNDPLRITDWNTIWQSGFYESFEAANAPEPYGWFWGLNMNHGTNNANYRYSGQIAIKNSSASPTMYFRSTDVNGNGSWAKLLNNRGDQAINGKLEAKEIKVTTTPTADFVFEEDYSLPNLDSIEKYVNKNKHLPEIPSAEEMEAEGVNVGVFQIQLLQKIEELTLYVIELKKETVKQQKEIQKLKKQIND
ncbi:hypothetical protein OOZ15_11770 [Galbibacter sp. EGI 63066]|uniref:hypothetical protein n=1 Tax=Galbibacter sp. EGI 63066 TaxID=2993559 RepID=UPI002248EEDC|nr:hypothetical protein [Galbibacter sp. EGI 63066]MCX2680621.1 hypothetical protein [Galbibacter sp. EGI 63066]